MKDNLLIIFGFTLIMFATSNANHAQAQYDLDYGFAAGTGHYLADIGGKEQIGRNFVSDLHLGSMRFSSHVFVRYRIHDRVALRGQLGTVQIAGDDAVSPMPRGLRNIHFRNFVNELSVRTEVSVWNQPFLTRRTSKVQMGLDTYLTLELTGFTHAPQARLDRDVAEYHFVRGNISTNPNLFDYDWWYDLRSVQTEPAKLPQDLARVPGGRRGGHDHQQRLADWLGICVEPYTYGLPRRREHHLKRPIQPHGSWRGVEHAVVGGIVCPARQFAS